MSTMSFGRLKRKTYTSVWKGRQSKTCFGNPTSEGDFPHLVVDVITYYWRRVAASDGKVDK